MKSLEKKLIIGIIAVSILLIITGIVSYKTLIDSIETARDVAHTHEVLTEIENTLSTLKDAETGQRGFLIAGQEDYLEPFHKANEDIRKRLARLKELTARNPRHRERLAALEPLIKARFDDLHRTVKLRRNEGFESAQKVVLANEGKEKMDSLRQLFDEMREEENTALQGHLASSEANAQNVIITFVILLVLIISLFCLIFLLVKWDISARNTLEAKLREMATTDALTGIYNRREMNRLLEQEITRFERYGNRVSLLLLDIDFFKSVNDKHGHQIGDEVLKWVAVKLRESIRTVDILARYGGEEFAVLLPETDLSGALVIAERARRQIAAAPLVLTPEEMGGGQPLEISITVSIGIAELTGIDSETSFIEAADKALYQAKSKGRNCAVTSEKAVSA